MEIKDIKTPGELYNAITGTTTPAERDNHCGDLYVKCSPAVMRMIMRYKYSSMVTTFRDQTDLARALWYDIPFAYSPYWEDLKK